MLLRVFRHRGWCLLLSSGRWLTSLQHLFLWNLMFIWHWTILDSLLFTERIFTLIRLRGRSFIVGTLMHIQVNSVWVISSSDNMPSRDLSSFRLVFLLLAHRDLSPLLCPSIQNNIVCIFDCVSSMLLISLVWLEYFAIILVSLRVAIKLCTTRWFRHMLKLLVLLTVTC
jgi:hypothetical protein